MSDSVVMQTTHNVLSVPCQTKYIVSIYNTVSVLTSISNADNWGKRFQAGFECLTYGPCARDFPTRATVGSGPIENAQPNNVSGIMIVSPTCQMCLSVSGIRCNF